MNTIIKKSPTLVIGGNGKTGRRIVNRLNALKLPVKIGSRSSEIPFDWNAPENWEKILSGCNAVYIAYSPDLAVPGATDSIRYLCELAKKVGIQKLVLLSGRGEPEAQACEEIVKNSGVGWSILRCSWFNQNFSESFLHGSVMSGIVALPVGQIKEPFVDVDDIADVAVAALTEEGHDGKLYELTGPELITFAKAVEMISKAANQEVTFQEITHEEFIVGLKSEQIPAEYIELLDYLFTEVLDGRNSCLANGVQQALGRAPRDFSSFVMQAAQDGVWARQKQALEKITN